MSVCVCALAFLCVSGWGRPCVAVLVVALAVSLWCLRSWKLVRIALDYLDHLDF